MTSTRVTLGGDTLRDASPRVRTRGLQDVLATIPGWGSEDNGLVHVRGVDEGVLYVVDGVPWYERFDSLFGVAPDPMTLESITVSTGYSPPEFGFKSGAVVEVRSAAAPSVRWTGAAETSVASESTGDGAYSLGESEAVPRLSDLDAALPAITGKIALEYEGDLIGAAAIARELIRRAAEATFRVRAGGANTEAPVMWFDEGGALEVAVAVDTSSMYEAFQTVPGLVDVVHHVGLARQRDHATAVAACELVLEALVARRKISRSDAGQYGRAHPEGRRRPDQDHFGGGLSA